MSPFNPKLTPTIINRLFPHLSSDWYPEFSQLPEYGINTNNRLAHFLAQVTHESNDFKTLTENLNYSSSGLRNTFSKYFTPSQAEQYARQPERIANRVYANRMGNGPESSGDGWKYRGRGAIQVTGKNNYTACSKFLLDNTMLVDFPELLTSPKYALLSAVWYWTTNNLNEIADTSNIELITRRINGGLNGIEDRKKRFNYFFKEFVLLTERPKII